MLGGHAADSDGQAEAARPGTARIEKEYAVLCLDLGLMGMTIDHSVDVVRGLGVKLGQNVYHINAEAIDQGVYRLPGKSLIDSMSRCRSSPARREG
jgi:hypothetical protein